MMLNIGASRTYIPGFVNIDIVEHADVSLDLNKEPIPHETSSVDLVFTYHTLEHLQNWLFTLGEVYRVLKHEGILLVGVPYAAGLENLGYPWHLASFTEHTFLGFDPERHKPEAREIKLKQVFCRIRHRMPFALLPCKSLLRKHLLGCAKNLEFGLVAVKRKSYRVPLPDELERKFQACLQGRVRYDGRPVGKTWRTGLYRWWKGL